MKICRFDDQRLGVVEGDNVLDVTEAVRVLPSLSWPLPCYDVFVANWPSIRKEIDSLKGEGAAAAAVAGQAAQSNRESEQDHRHCRQSKELRFRSYRLRTRC